MVPLHSDRLGVQEGLAVPPSAGCAADLAPLFAQDSARPLQMSEYVSCGISKK
jgi:hypothetical protein